MTDPRIAKLRKLRHEFHTLDLKIARGDVTDQASVRRLRRINDELLAVKHALLNDGHDWHELAKQTLPLR